MPIHSESNDPGSRTTFFLKFRVSPTEHNSQHQSIAGAYAACWVQGENAESAYGKAYFFVTKGEWAIDEIETSAVQVSEEDFVGQDIGHAQFLVAQQHGIAITYVAWSLDGTEDAQPKYLEEPKLFDLNGYIKIKNKLSKSGRCLHYESGSRCTSYIGAHSIQKSGQLSEIAQDGHVYAISKNFRDVAQNKGCPSLTKQGIGTVSTFLGFCGKHDNSLFAPIDRGVIDPTDEQVALYAYRSICREIFVKENALQLFEEQLKILPSTSAWRSNLEAFQLGTSLGLENLRGHKSEMDRALANQRYSDVEYVLFVCEQPQFVAFSGLIYPEFDFQGGQLQDLASPQCRFSLLTFCSAPASVGWGFLFAWHKISSAVCRELMRSLAMVMHEDQGRGADAMFRLVVSNCENLAFSPAWWEALSFVKQTSILECLSRGADLFTPINSQYLVQGVEGICQWGFGDVYTAY